MVARNSPDWLPSGWTVQFKVQKTGRKIKFYTNLETGQKYFSKDDVIHCIKVNSSKGRKPPPTNRHIKRHSINNPKPLALETNERPGWLPKGWNMEVKARNSGIGAKYKCYIDPLTGCRFYSKPQVFRYLETVKRSSWTFKKRKTDIVMPLVVVEKPRVEDLPAGWIKEIKIRKNAYGIRRDPYYTDLGNGYVFRSKKDALRYLETGEIRRYAFKPKKSCINSEELINGETSASSAVKRQKLNHPETRRRLYADKGSSNKSNLELAEAKSSKRERGNKVSAEQRDAFAPTAEIVQDKHSTRDTIKESTETKENYNTGRSALPKADGSKRKSQPKSLPANNGPVSTPAVDILQEKNDLENVKEKSSTRRNKITSSKSKKKKEYNLPSRSSKRLAGLEPEQVVNSVSSQQAFQVSTRKFSESGAGQGPGLAPCGLSNGASQRLKDGQEMANAHHGSTDLSDALHGEPSDESKKPLKNEAASKGQLEMLETDKMDDEVREQEHCCPFGNSWSDPCLEFAIKTLTGALPLEDTANNRAVLTPAADILQKENSLEGGIKKRSTSKIQVNSKKSKNKKELNLPRRSSKRLAGFEPEMVANSLFSEQATQTASRKSCESKATLPVVLEDGASRQLEAGLDMELAHHASNNINTPVLGESSNKSEKPLEVQVVPEEQLPLGVQVVPKEQLQMPETEIIPEPQLAFPFGDSWLDPCLEFAFKTLTGAIPVEDNLAVQGSFQEQLDISRTRRDSSLALPDFGLPSFFQNDISSHFDLSKNISSHFDSPEKSMAGHQLSMSSSFLAPGNVSLLSCRGIGSEQHFDLSKNISSHFDSPEKSMAGHQPSMSSSFLAPGNVSLPSCGGIGSEQPCSKGNKGLHGKVNS